MRKSDHRHYPNGPKILPWLAHKAGISEHRAELLWHAAVRHADHLASKGQSSSDYWQVAMAHLEALIAAEAQREDAASFGWRPWSRNLAERWSARIELFDEIALAPIRTLRILGQHGSDARAPH